MVSRIEGVELRHTFEPGRLGFLFVADGAATVSAFDDHDAQVATERLNTGDAIRIAGITRLSLKGTGEIVLWDVPRLPDGVTE